MESNVIVDIDTNYPRFDCLLEDIAADIIVTYNCKYFGQVTIVDNYHISFFNFFLAVTKSGKNGIDFSY